MAKPFKFRYVNHIVGSFVLLTVGLVVVSIAMIAMSKRWFTTNQTVLLKIPGGLSTDLREGADVVIGGIVAGVVQKPGSGEDPSATFATLSIPGDFMSRVHADSIVEIRRSLGGVGEAYVKISGGVGPPPRGPLVVNPKNIETNPSEMAQRVLRENIVPLLQSVNRVTDGINDPNGDFQQTLVHAHHLAASVDKGDGVAARLINDRQLADKVAQILPHLNASLESLHALLQDTQKTTAQLPRLATSLNQGMDQFPALLEELRQAIKQINAIAIDIQKTTATLPRTTLAVNQTAEAMPGVILQTQETLRQLQRLLEGAQRSWLLRSYVEPEAPTGARISTDRVSP